jgi:tetratricopeptide (TPR) repeat protein
MKTRTRPLLTTRTAALLLGALTLAAFWRTLFQNFQIYDDPGYVTSNPMVLDGLTFRGVLWAFTTGTEANWHPLTWLSHMADIQFFGLHPFYHHAVNVALQALAAVALYVALVRLTKSAGRSFFVAAVFAVHPLQVESVAWIAERKDVLSGLLGMLTLLAYVRYREQPVPKRYGAVAAGLLLGLLAKPTLVVLPVLFLLLDFWPLQRFNDGTFARRAWELIREKLPLFGLCLLSGVVTWFAQAQGGAMKFAESLSLGDRLGNAAISCAKYLGMAFWPSGLAVLYPHPGDALPAAALAGSVAVLVVATLAVLRWRRAVPALVTGWFWFLAALVPVIGIAQVGLQAMADRYMHIPIIGLAIAFAWGATALAERFGIRTWTRGLLGGGLVAALSVATVVQSGYWESSIALFQRAVDVTEENWVAHNNLGVALEGGIRFREARAHYREALRIHPDYVEASVNLANGLANDGQTDSAEAILRRAIVRTPRNVDLRAHLGSVLMRKGRADAALAEYARAYAEDSSRSDILHQMTQVAADAGMLAEAESLAGRFLQQHPDGSDAHDLLGTIYAQKGAYDEAYRQFREAVKLDAENVSAHFNLGLLYEQEGKPESAMTSYDAALRSDPEFWNAHQRIGTLYARKGDLAAARSHFTDVIRLKPDLADGQNNLGKLFEMEGQDDSAMAHFNMALAIEPGHAQAHYNMGALLVRKGEPAKAADHLRAALAVDPNLEEAKVLLRTLEQKGGQR